MPTLPIIEAIDSRVAKEDANTSLVANLGRSAIDLAIVVGYSIEIVAIVKDIDPSIEETSTIDPMRGTTARTTTIIRSASRIDALYA
jgi:hypothetical protein